MKFIFLFFLSLIAFSVRGAEVVRPPTSYQDVTNIVNGMGSSGTGSYVSKTGGVAYAGLTNNGPQPIFSPNGIFTNLTALGSVTGNVAYITTIVLNGSDVATAIAGNATSISSIQASNVTAAANIAANTALILSKAPNADARLTNATHVGIETNLGGLTVASNLTVGASGQYIGNGAGITNIPPSAIAGSSYVASQAGNSTNQTLYNGTNANTFVTGSEIVNTNFTIKGNVTGQTFSINTNQFVFTNGLMGIGTATPDVTLTIGATLLTSQGLSGAVLNLGGSTAQTPGFNIGQDAGHGMTFYWVGNATPGNAVAHLEANSYANNLLIDAKSVSINSASGGLVTIRNSSISTNSANFPPPTQTNYVSGQRYTNTVAGGFASTRAMVQASASCVGAVAGTGKLTLFVEHGTAYTNSCPASVNGVVETSVFPMLMLLSAGDFFYFTDGSSGGGSATIVAGTGLWEGN